MKRFFTGFGIFLTLGMVTALPVFSQSIADSMEEGNSSAASGGQVEIVRSIVDGTYAWFAGSGLLNAHAHMAPSPGV